MPVARGADAVGYPRPRPAPRPPNCPGCASARSAAGPTGSPLAAVPEDTVLLDLPLPARYGGLIGRASLPYMARINRALHQGAAARGLPVAGVSAHFIPPWTGKFARDCFHPSQDGYRDWTRALLAAI
jgi:lysophospholipase L1-like esterase